MKKIFLAFVLLISGSVFASYTVLMADGRTIKLGKLKSQNNEVLAIDYPRSSNRSPYLSASKSEILWHFFRTNYAIAKPQIIKIRTDFTTIKESLTKYMDSVKAHITNLEKEIAVYKKQLATPGLKPDQAQVIQKRIDERQLALNSSNANLADNLKKLQEATDKADQAEKGIRQDHKNLIARVAEIIDLALHDDNIVLVEGRNAIQQIMDILKFADYFPTGYYDRTLYTATCKMFERGFKEGDPSIFEIPVYGYHASDLRHACEEVRFCGPNLNNGRSGELLSFPVKLTAAELAKKFSMVQISLHRGGKIESKTYFYGEAPNDVYCKFGSKVGGKFQSQISKTEEIFSLDLPQDLN